MKGDKTALMAGMLPLIALIVLLGSSFATKNGWIVIDTASVILVQIMAFVLPGIIGFIATKSCGDKMKLPLARIKLRPFLFTVTAALAASFLAFLLNLLLMSSAAGSAAPASAQLNVGGTWALTLLTVAVIPALLEEFLFRGVMQSMLSKLGTAVSILVPAICFSLIHMDVQNIMGSLICGLICGYLVHSFGSIALGIIAHFICNSYYLIMSFLLDSFKVFGLMPYFIAINILLFLGFSYISLRILEKSIIKKEVSSFIHTPLASLISTTVASPGFMVFVLIICMSLIYKI